MKTKTIVVSLLSLTFLFCPIANSQQNQSTNNKTDTGQNYTIYDRGYNQQGYVNNGTIYDRGYNVKGYYKQDSQGNGTIYDRGYNPKGYYHSGGNNRGK